MILPLRYAPNWIRSWAAILFAALAVALIFVPLKAQANPVVCNGLADYGITAAALAKQERAGKLEPAARAQILADMYFPDAVPSRELAAIVARIERAARSTRLSPAEFANDLVRRCMGAGGNPDLFLGVDS